MRLPKLLLSTMLALAPLAQAATPVTSVDTLDIGRYAGQWHEIAHLPMVFQDDCTGEITATYSLRADGMIGVRNRCAVGDGGYSVAEAVARPVEGHAGRLEVRFAPEWLSWLPLVWADYWVIALDPDYQWAVVGQPDRKYLWILSRSPRMSRLQFEQLKGKAIAMGYDLSELIVAAPLD